MSGLVVHNISPIASLQDMGRAGYLKQGLSRGGAADRQALAEGAALLGQSPGIAALEMAGTGGEFEATGDLRIALTGAPMVAMLDGVVLAWNASHALVKGQRLILGAAKSGVYGYLHFGGGIDAPEFLGSRSAHLLAGIGRRVQTGDHLTCGPDQGEATGLGLKVSDRFHGGPVRVVPSVQTNLFAPDVLERFQVTKFTRGPRANRMGVEMLSGGGGFTADGQLDILSEVIVPGDIQMTGDGLPFVLLPECQTTGGYPRIATVIPCDLGLVAQAPAGAAITFEFVTLDQALAAQARYGATLKGLKNACQPLIRDVANMGDLLSYQLISGAISAHDDKEDGNG
ncbi:MAG: biotin-dependent carboxyltransferase family protein [Rhodobacteraceae bacterium]|nr:biotin-dependent carboxyltransferase family protein [Paracoccaceae bacterium]